MHLPPAVTVDVRRSVVLGACVAAIALLVASVCVGFWASQTGVFARCLVSTAAIATVAMAWRGWCKSARGRLAWDGTHWQWSGFGGDANVTLEVVADFQSLVCVHIANARQGHVYLCLERGVLPMQHWRAIRRAFVAASRGAGQVRAASLERGAL